MREFKIEMGHNPWKHYELYKRNFDFLDKETYHKLYYFGKLGALMRGEEIIMEEHDIHIKSNWWRQDFYKSREVPMPLTRPSATPLDTMK